MSCLSIPGVHFKLGDQGYQCGDYLKTVFARLATAYRDVPIVVINRTSVYVWGHNEDTLDKFAERWCRLTAYPCRAALMRPIWRALNSVMWRQCVPWPKPIRSICCSRFLKSGSMFPKPWHAA